MVIGDYTVDQVIEKAQTLIEAMPYIKKFQGKTVVVKYGGSAMLDENLKYNVIKDVAMLKLVGMKPVIVHGGGKEISKWRRSARRQNLSTVSVLQMQRRWRSQRWFSARSTRVL